MKKKEVIIFGSSGGLGLELVRVFLKNNYRVICICSSKKKVKSLKKNLNFSKQCEFKICDLARKRDVNNFKKFIKNRSKNVELIVFASATLTVSKFSEIPIKNFNNDIQINALSFIEIFREFIKYKKKLYVNAIIILSNTSIVGIKNFSSYCISKSILERFVESISDEIKNSNFLLVYPGPMKTQFDDNAKVINKNFNYKLNNKRSLPHNVAKKFFRYYLLKKKYLFFKLTTRILYIIKGLSPTYLSKIINYIYK